LVVNDAEFAFADAQYCTSSSDPSPWIAQVGGTFTSSPSGLVIDPATGAIDLAASAIGTYFITYTLDGPCGDATTEQVAIMDAMDASWTAPTELCSTSGSIDLSALVTGDAGGSWTGPGVIGSTFDPAGLNGAQAVTYSVGTGACSVEQTWNILVTPQPAANAGSDETVCGTTYELGATATNGTGVWSGPAGISFANTSDPSTQLVAASFGTYTLTWTVSNGACQVSDQVTLTFLNPDNGLWVDAGPDQNLEVFDHTLMNGQASEGATVNWSLLWGGGSLIQPDSLHTPVHGLATGDNVFVLVATLGPCASRSDTVVIHVDDLFIPEGYSPNGDAVNDTWAITGIAAFPGSSLKVFNRWGQLVYENDSYNNDWDGGSRNGGTLPDDTYFYVLNLGAARTYNGHVIIKR
jgi:gliding motility-associated-like protein